MSSTASLQSFQTKYEQAAIEMERDWQQQLAKATKLQEDYLDRITQQQQRLAELTKTELRLRQQAISQSLEQFRKSYDDTFERLNLQVSSIGLRRVERGHLTSIMVFCLCGVDLSNQGKKKDLDKRFTARAEVRQSS